MLQEQKSHQLCQNFQFHDVDEIYNTGVMGTLSKAIDSQVMRTEKGQDEREDVLSKDLNS